MIPEKKCWGRAINVVTHQSKGREFIMCAPGIAATGNHSLIQPRYLRLNAYNHRSPLKQPRILKHQRP